MRNILIVLGMLILIIACEIQMTIVKNSENIMLNEGQIQKDSIGVQTKLKK